MNLPRSRKPLWLLPLVLAGCSSTVGSRFGGSSQSRSITVNGDRALPASTGEPGGKVVADSEDPEPRLNPKTRISGRVIDEAGDPIAGATVRLADGAVKGGKEIRGTTDRSGAFSLNGLRPGSFYVLIAEAEDEHGPIVGRVEAKTAETGVEIAATSGEPKPTARRSARPARAKPVSNREDVGEVEDQGEAPNINREDVAPPAEEADTLDPGPPRPTPVGRPQLSAPQPGVGWKNSKNATASRPKDEDVEGNSTTSDALARPRRTVKTKAPARVDPDEEEDPLPPALEAGAGDDPDRSARSNSSKKVGANVAKPRQSGEIALAPEASLDPKEKEKAVSPLEEPARPGLTAIPDLELDPSIFPKPNQVAESAKPAAKALSELPAMPQPGGEPVAVASQGAPSPTPSPPDPPKPTQDVPPSNPAPQPVFALNDPATKPAEKLAATADYNPFAELTPARFPIDKAVANPPIDPPPAPDVAPVVADESPKKKWGELVAVEKPAVVVQPAKLTLTGAILKRMRGVGEGRDPAVAACSYDAKLRKINDFRLPDLEGKPVRFQELDADFILLDFWGTWCEPCLDAIPHLVTLQKKYGPARLKVVGIACEELPPDRRKAKVDEVSRKFGINYPVLLSTMDGKPCPVQKALQIQAMPTMILVDRKGQVLWRNAGLTPESESRLDKVIALSMGRAESARR